MSLVGCIWEGEFLQFDVSYEKPEETGGKRKVWAQ